VHYDARGQAKLVTFWSMRHCGGEFAPSDEVRELRWLPIAAAREQLTYDTDRNALAALDPIPEALVVLVRHAKAGKRSEWDGEDADRPLEPSGRTQADRLADVLPLFVPTGVFSAGLVRCRQTVSPLAERLGRVVAEAPRFADEVSAADPEATVAALRALATRDAVTVVCSQGETIPRLVATLTGRESVQTRKGAFWVLGFTGGSCVSADYYSAR
jgi:8-oxo-dGTP diphosphatase